MKKYSRALDLLLVAALNVKEGKHAEAAKFLTKATEEPDFNETVETLNDENQEATDNVDDEDTTEEELTKALSRLNKGKRKVNAEADDEEDYDEDDEDEADDEGVEESASMKRRKARAQANARLIKANTKK